MAKTRRDAALKAADAEVDRTTINWGRRGAKAIAKHVIEGTPRPTSTRAFERDRGKEAAAAGLEHAYGDNIPPEMQQRLDEL